MATLTDYTDALIDKGIAPKATRQYTLFVENEEALYLSAYGERPSGNPHNHSSGGGELLERSLVTAVLGSYSRPGSGAAPTVGVPCYPPVAGTDFSLSGGANWKLLCHAGVYLPGGHSNVRVRLGVRFTGAGARNLTLRCVLRPTSRLGISYSIAQNQTGASAVISTTGANDFVNQTCLLGNLSRLGDVNQARWAELLILCITNPPAASTPRILGFKVDPVPTADAPPPNGTGLPRVQVDTRDIQQGASISERLWLQVRSMMDGLIHAVLGKIPGKRVEWGQPAPKEDKTIPYRAEIKEENAGTGIHTHQGASVFDGALIPGQVALICPIADMGDTAANEMSKAPVIGPLIDPTGAGSGTPAALRKFRFRAAVSKGDSKFVVKVAMAPRVSTVTATLWMLCRSYGIAPNGTIDTNVDIISAIEQGQQTEEDSKVSSYWQMEVQPEDCGVYATAASRAATGKFGHWTSKALLPAAQRPDESLGDGDSAYRVSKEIAITITPGEVTKDYIFEFAFYLLNNTGTPSSAPTLQWLAMARPEEV